MSFPRLFFPALAAVRLQGFFPFRGDLKSVRLAQADFFSVNWKAPPPLDENAMGGPDRPCRRMSTKETLPCH
jgi:hypothetical protein